jgi:cell division protein FtsB
VRPHIAWYLRWGMMLPFVLAAMALVWFAYDKGLEFAGFHRGETERELEMLHSRVEKLSNENSQLNAKVLKLQQDVKIEQGSGQEAARQIKGLSEENVRLQEDLSFFQNLTATRGKQGELSILRLSLEHDKIPGEYRVRMLLAQSGQRVKEFVGGYQLVATFVQNGHKITLQFPSEQAGHAQFALNFKYYQNSEQNIRLPADAQLQNVQVRLFKQDAREPSVRQSVNLS